MLCTASCAAVQCGCAMHYRVFLYEIKAAALRAAAGAAVGPSPHSSLTSSPKAATPPWRLAAPYRRMLSGIRGIRLAVLQVDAKFKYDDANPVEHHHRVIGRLKQRGHELDAEAATQEPLRLATIRQYVRVHTKVGRSRLQQRQHRLQGLVGRHPAAARRDTGKRPTRMGGGQPFAPIPRGRSEAPPECGY